MCAHARVCVYLCSLSIRVGTSLTQNLQHFLALHNHVHVIVSVCVCVHVCVCVCVHIILTAVHHGSAKQCLYRKESRHISFQHYTTLLCGVLQMAVVSKTGVVFLTFLC